MSWRDETRWAEILAGNDCGMCDDAHLDSNPFSDLITELPTTYARLARNQSHPGYCVVVLKEHVTELHHLPLEELDAFWRDVALVGRAIAEVFHPVKLNNLVMGHRMPHLHCHVYPQYLSDDPLRNVDISEGEVVLGPEAKAVRLLEIRRAIYELG